MRADLAHRADEVFLGGRIQVLLVKRRGIERVEQLSQLAQPDLDEVCIPFAAIGIGPTAAAGHGERAR